MSTADVPTAAASDPYRRSISDRRLFHIGALSGFFGGIVAFPFVVTHPHLPPGDASGVLQTVLDFGPWLFLHMGLMFVLLVILAGLAAFSRSIREETASGWATCAWIIGLIGTVFGILGQGVDGLGFEVAANVWQTAAPEDKGTAVIMAAGVAGVATGIFILVLFFYFGLTSLAYGLAFARSHEYPQWLAVLALLGGTMGFAAACFTYFDDFSDPVYYGLFIPSAVIFLLWVIAASALLWVKEVRPHRAAAIKEPKAAKPPKPAKEAKPPKESKRSKSKAGV